MLNKQICSWISRAVVATMLSTLMVPMTLGMQTAFADAPCELSKDGKRMVCSEDRVPAAVNYTELYNHTAREVEEVQRSTFDTELVEASVVDIEGDDDCDTGYEIGFDFDYFGTTITTVGISTNGVVDMSDGDACYDFYDNESLTYGFGDSEDPDNILMPFWDDQSSVIYDTYYATVGDEGEQKFIVQWTNHYHLYTNGEGDYEAPIGTYQMILDEATGTIQYQYLNVLQGRTGRGKFATIGLIGDYTDEDQVVIYSNLEESVEAGMAISFTPVGDTTYTVDDEAEFQDYYLELTGLEFPSLSSPEFEETDIAYPPTLTWNASDFAEFYSVTVSTDPFFETGIANDDDEWIADSVVYYNSYTEDTSIDLSEEVDDNVFLPGMTYYWFVIGYDVDGETLTGEMSDVWSFTTEEADAFSGDGSGTEEDPYQISSCEEFMEINDHLGEVNYYILTTDLDCAEYESDMRVGSEFAPFIGDFDGNDHSILFDIELEEGEFVGLFARIQDTTITDLTVGGYIFGRRYLGGLTGFAFDSVINNCVSDVVIDSNMDPEDNTADMVGGLVGFFVDGLMDNSEATGDIYGQYENIGGLAGMILGSTVTDSSASGSVYGYYDTGGFAGDVDESTVSGLAATGYTEGFSFVAGLIGDTDTDVSITDSYATGDVYAADDEENQYTGGLVGQAEDGVTIERSFATGNVQGVNYVGGFIGGTGYDYDSVVINDSYARGDAIGFDYVGGFAGYVYGSEITNVYSTGEVIYDELAEYVGGLVGSVYDEEDAELEEVEGWIDSTFTATFWDTSTSGIEISEEGEGKDTAAMNSLITFTTDLGDDAWDFADVWSMVAGTNDGYPYLDWYGGAHDDVIPANRHIVSSGGAGSSSKAGEDELNEMDYLAEVQAMVDRGIVEKELTKTSDKCEALVIMSRAFNWSLGTETESQFADIPSWCVAAANFAAENGIVEGRSEGSLGLDTPVTRYEVAVMLYRELKRQGYEFDGNVSFSFNDSIVDWAREAVEALAREGIIKGFADGTFGGDKGILKQDLGVMVVRVAG